MRKKPRVIVDSLGSLLPDSESIGGGEPKCAEDSQSILTESGVGVSHAVYSSTAQVIYAAVRVYDAIGIVVGNGIDSEVPASQILSDVTHERHAVGSPVI